MPLHVLTGSDAGAIRARRAQLRNGAGGAELSVERFDLTVDGGDQLVAAASMFSLFGGPRLLDADPLSAMTAANAERLAAAIREDVTVVLHGPNAPTAALRKALAGAVHESLSVPGPRDAAGRVTQAAAEHSVTLDLETHAFLTALAPSNWALVRGALSELAALGRMAPSMADVRALTGTASAPATPWVLSDKLEAGDLLGALDVADHLEAIPTVAYLAKRIGQVGRLVDAGATDAGRASELLGTGIPASRKLVDLATRLGPAGVARSWDLLGAADRATKLSGRPSDTLSVLTHRLAALWRPHVS